MAKYTIHEDIRMASTLDADIYSDENAFRFLINNLFLNSWQLIPTWSMNALDFSLFPFSFLEGSVDEPMIYHHGEDQKLCYSNVCTHRGMILLEKPSKSSRITCAYHGRCFRKDGSFKSMPEFQQADNFPSSRDHLMHFPMEKLGHLQFCSVFGKMDFQKLIQPVIERLNWFPFEKLRFDASLSRDYEVEANWMLYCENYLEGFHVPFVHEALNSKIAYGSYETHLFPLASLQMGLAAEGETYFDLPEQSPDFGKKVFAYYYFLFPNLMLNFYPWGLSLNSVEPQGVSRTKIRFLTFLLPNQSADQFEDTALHKTEMEDEYVVQQVQKGTRSRAYKIGRFSPTMETGVHHFQSLVSRYLEGL